MELKRISAKAFIVSASVALSLCILSSGFTTRAMADGTDENQLGYQDIANRNLRDTTTPGLEAAGSERVAKATGHYARARSLIIAALNEFDKGNKIARPDALINTTTFRDTLKERATDLEKILAPQARISRGGVAFSDEPRLLKQNDSN